MSNLQFAELITANVKAGIREYKILEGLYTADGARAVADFASMAIGLPMLLMKLNWGVSLALQLARSRYITHGNHFANQTPKILYMR